MIEIIEERKEPDLNTEDKKVSEELKQEADAQEAAAGVQAKAAEGCEEKSSCQEGTADVNEEKSSDSEAAATEEKTETAKEALEPEKSEAGESAGKPGAGESTGNPEAGKESGTADGKADAEEASDKPEAADDKDTAQETENGDKEPDMLFGSRKLKKEIEKKDELIKEKNEKYIRLMAEFDNYRKRTEKEKAGMYAMGAKDVVEKILPVVDNFERGFSLVAEEDAEDPFTEGMQKIYKQLMTTLTDLGVTPIEAVGKEFDPNLHNAVMHVDDESVGENIVVQEFQKGYMYKDSVVRHSMVQVAN